MSSGPNRAAAYMNSRQLEPGVQDQHRLNADNILTWTREVGTKSPLGEELLQSIASGPGGVHFLLGQNPGGLTVLQ